MKIILFFILSISLNAKLTTFEWDRVTVTNPDNAIIRTHLFMNSFILKDPVFLAESYTNTVTIDLLPGDYKISASSENKQGFGPFCDPIPVVILKPIDPPITPIPTKKKFILQKTIDLIKWEDVAELLDDEEVQFYRIEIVTP